LSGLPPPCTLLSTPYTLNSKPDTLNPTAYTHMADTRHPERSAFGAPKVTARASKGTLHPTPYTLHPTPYTLHPTPYTLHPKSQILPLLSKEGDPQPSTLRPRPSTRNQVGEPGSTQQATTFSSTVSLHHTMNVSPTWGANVVTRWPPSPQNRVARNPCIPPCGLQSWVRRLPTFECVPNLINGSRNNGGHIDRER
jgi:hypothetical protein